MTKLSRFPVLHRIWYRLGRYFNSINLENRAFKLLDRYAKTRPTPAPHYKSEDEALAKVAQENPELIRSVREDLVSKDPSLDDKLKSVRIKSTVDVQPERRLETSRPKPKYYWPYYGEPDRTEPFGILEPPPERIPDGKMTLSQSLNVLQSFQAEPSRENFDRITSCGQLRLSRDQTKKMLRYFGLFTLPEQSVKLIGDGKACGEFGEGFRAFADVKGKGPLLLESGLTKKGSEAIKWPWSPYLPHKQAKDEII